MKERLTRFHVVSRLIRVTATPVLGEGATSSVKVTNVSQLYLAGPLMMAFISLPRGVRLASVIDYAVAGDLFVAPILTGLAPGQSGTAIVRFTGPLSLTSPEIAGEILAEVPLPPLSLAPAPRCAPDSVGGHALDPSAGLILPIDLLASLADRKV